MKHRAQIGGLDGSLYADLARIDMVHGQGEWMTFATDWWRYVSDDEERPFRTLTAVGLGGPDPDSGQRWYSGGDYWGLHRMDAWVAALEPGHDCSKGDRKSSVRRRCRRRYVEEQLGYTAWQVVA